MNARFRYRLQTFLPHKVSLFEWLMLNRDNWNHEIRHWNLAATRLTLWISTHACGCHFHVRSCHVMTSQDSAFIAVKWITFFKRRKNISSSAVADNNWTGRPTMSTIKKTTWCGHYKFKRRVSTVFSVFLTLRYVEIWLWVVVFQSWYQYSVALIF